MWYQLRVWYEIPIITFVQNKLASLESLFLVASHIGEPGFGFVYYFPFFMSLISLRSAHRIIWTVVISEWVNIIMKWVFSDDRPYWWVKEFVQPEHRVPFKQFSISCETGPGMPSGHVSITASVWYMLANELFRNKILIRRPKQKFSLYIILLFLLSLVAASRIYISAHFPDQCLFGLFAGVAVAVVVDRLVEMEKSNFIQHLAATIVMIVVSFLTNYLVHDFRHKSRDWSLDLAKKWCFDTRFVKADTTPLFVVWRTAGAMLGIGIAFYLVVSLFRKSTKLKHLVANKQNELSLFLRSLIGLVAICLVKLFMTFSKPDPTNLARINYFYCMTFLQYTALPIVVVLSFALSKFIFLKAKQYF